MTTPKYPVLCMHQGCRAAAHYKIASVWSDGTTQELKTYGLACDTHLAQLFRAGCTRQMRCRLTESETLSRPQVFRIQSGLRDRELVRDAELEEKLLNLPR